MMVVLRSVVDMDGGVDCGCVNKFREDLYSHFAPESLA